VKVFNPAAEHQGITSERGGGSGMFAYRKIKVFGGELHLQAKRAADGFYEGGGICERGPQCLRKVEKKGGAGEKRWCDLLLQLGWAKGFGWFAQRWGIGGVGGPASERANRRTERGSE